MSIVATCFQQRLYSVHSVQYCISSRFEQFCWDLVRTKLCWLHLRRSTCRKRSTVILHTHRAHCLLHISTSVYRKTEVTEHHTKKLCAIRLSQLSIFVGYEAVATISAYTDRRAGPSATADSCQCLLCIQANGAAMRLVWTKAFANFAGLRIMSVHVQDRTDCSDMRK